MFTSTNTSDYSFLDCPPIRPLVMEKTATTTKWRYTNNEIAPNCPRCASSNTKFCYYNNYSLSQPRYFCKGCRRYWTKGGSLRNVPVGGGCRKSRRARAARQGVAVHCPGPTPSPGPVGSTEGGSGIDLAAVFAKYVNSNDENLSHSLSSSYENVQTSSLDIDSQLDDTSAMFEYHQEPLDLINGGDDQIQQLISMHEDMNGQDFVYQDCNAFEPQDNILGDDLWSSDGSNLSNFGSQNTMLQLQDLGLFSGDDQFRNPTNLVSDYWGAFDLSAYEIFSRP